MDQASSDLERAAAYLLGVETQFLTKANSREAIGSGVEYRVQKLAIVDPSARLLVEACQSL